MLMTGRVCSHQRSVAKFQVSFSVSGSDLLELSLCEDLKNRELFLVCMCMTDNVQAQTANVVFFFF